MKQRKGLMTRYPARAKENLNFSYSRSSQGQASGTNHAIQEL